MRCQILDTGSTVTSLNANKTKFTFHKVKQRDNIPLVLQTLTTSL